MPVDGDRRAMTWGLAALLFTSMNGYAGRARAARHQSSRLPVEGGSPSLEGATAWLNSSLLSGADLLGKVVLVNFWTYSSIGSHRSLPYVRAWADKYRHAGLVVIGAHTPDFEFEKVVDNVRRAALDTNIEYPIAIDNQYQLWNGFENEFWPALYLIDAQGRIRYHHAGEGDYAAVERNIQYLLEEAGVPEVSAALVSIEGSGAEAPSDIANLKSLDNYLGYSRSERFESGGQKALNEPCEFLVPHWLDLNHWGLSGTWVVRAQSVSHTGSRGRITYAFHARDLYLVMGRGDSSAAARFRVTLDGEAPGEAHGLDVDPQGYGSIVEPRIYRLIRQPTPILDRRFAIEFLDAGAEAFSFTFG